MVQLAAHRASYACIGAAYGCPGALYGCIWLPKGCVWLLRGCFGLAVGLHLAAQRLQWGALGWPWGCIWLLRGCNGLPMGLHMAGQRLHLAAEGLHFAAQGPSMAPMRQICSICCIWLGRAGARDGREDGQSVVNGWSWAPNPSTRMRDQGSRVNTSRVKDGGCSKT